MYMYNYNLFNKYYYFKTVFCLLFVGENNQEEWRGEKRKRNNKITEKIEKRLKKDKKK